MAYNYDDYIKPINETVYDWNKLDDSGNAIGTQQTTYTNPNNPGNIDINGLQYQLYGNKLTANNNGKVYQYDAIKNADGTLGWNNYSESQQQGDWYKEPTVIAGLALMGGAGMYNAGMFGASGAGGWTGAGLDGVAGDTAATYATGGSATAAGGSATGYSLGGGGGGSSVGDLADIGDWSNDDWSKWANANESGTSMTGPDRLLNAGDLSGWGDAASPGAPGSYSLSDIWKGINSGASTFRNFVGNGNNGSGSTAGLLAAYLQSQQQNKMGQQFLDMTKPYRDASALYGQKLQQTYDDPGSYLNGPEYQAIARTNLDLFNRQDSAGGRLGNDIGRQAKMQDLAMESLNKYRSGLAGIYQTNAGIGTGQGTQTGIALQGTQYSPYARWLGGQ